MNSRLDVPLQLDPPQQQRMRDLQATFAQACNLLAPIARDTRCWNRVALHHMTYKMLRERFPQLGSQMACNVIYSVSRACRIVYQHPSSPHHLSRVGADGLPLLHFQPDAPVYFDRHTLSLRNGRMSMFTLDGRMKFDLTLSPEWERRFRDQRLREIALNGDGQRYVLSFHFAEPAEPAEADAPAEPVTVHTDDPAGGARLPEHIRVMGGEPPRAPETPTPTAP